MEFSLTQLFGLHSAILLVVALLFVRSLPLSTRLLTAMVHMTVPAIILVKGNQSAFYLVDFIAPLFALYALFAKHEAEEADASEVRWAMTALLLLVPICTGALVFGMSASGPSTLRDMQEAALFFVRNLALLSVFVFMTRTSMTGDRALRLIQLVLLLSSVSAGMGMLSYFGPFNFAVFEQLELQKNAEAAEFVHANRIGSGFLGLFRASVGVWYACVVLVAVACLSVLKGFYRWVAVVSIALGIGVVLLSYSRAGVVGLAVGLLVMALLGGSMGQRMTAIGATFVAGLWLVLQSDVIGNRLGSIVSADDDASAGRLHVWARSFALFKDDIMLLLFGAGPASRGRVFELVGAYGAHNEYIDVIFRMGILGPILVATIICLVARALWIRRALPDASARAICSGVFAALAANSVMGLTQDHLVQDYAAHISGVFVYFLYGAGLGIRTQSVAGAAATPPATAQPWQPPNLMGARLSSEHGSRA